MRNARLLITMAAMAVLFVGTIYAQTTEFNYQGSLNDGANPANGNYDLEFRLFDAVSGGTQKGSTLTANNIAVANGIFSVPLDFGAQFPGPGRFLEIRVRTTGGGAFTLLAPRQSVNSSPYSIKSLTSESATMATNATQLGGLAANQYVVTTDPRMSDPRPPTAGSANYVQNSTNTQTSSNFNISGSGTAGGTLSGDTVNAATQYNIGGVVALKYYCSNQSISLGFEAAPNQGCFNGGFNSAFGNRAGKGFGIGCCNSAFGYSAGENSFGFANSFFGSSAGKANTTGFLNSFFGTSSGNTNLTGERNSFFGVSAGVSNITGNLNTLVGQQADVGAGDLTNASAYGALALVTQSNSLVLGSINGQNFATADTNVGIGTTAPAERLHVAVNGGQVLFGDAGCSSGFTGIGFGTSLSGCNNYSLLGEGENTIVSRPTGGSLTFREANTTQLTIAPGGVVRIHNFAAATATNVCRTAIGELAVCSSLAKFKTDIESFKSGLELVKRLRPVSFNWTSDRSRDLGLVAEEVNDIDPLLVTRDANGELEGVKYDRIGVVLVNAVKEQQAQIEAQDVKIKSLETQLEAFKVLVCSQNPSAEVCRLNK